MKSVFGFFVASSILVSVVLGAPLEETTLSVNLSPVDDKLEALYVKEPSEVKVNQGDQSTETKSEDNAVEKDVLTNLNESTSEQGSEIALPRQKRNPQHHHHYNQGGHGHGNYGNPHYQQGGHGQYGSHHGSHHNSGHGHHG